METTSILCTDGVIEVEQAVFDKASRVGHIITEVSGVVGGGGVAGVPVYKFGGTVAEFRRIHNVPVPLQPIVGVPGTVVGTTPAITPIPPPLQFKAHPQLKTLSSWDSKVLGLMLNDIGRALGVTWS